MAEKNEQIEQVLTHPVTQKRDSTFYWLIGIMFMAILVRLYAFVGWGLGDDSYYASAAYLITKGHFPNLLFGSNYRFGLHLPTAISFLLFGRNDFSFVLFPLLCSLATIPVIYFIGKEIAGDRVGLLAAALLTFSPFDAVFASTMTTDIITSFLSALAFLLFLKADRADGPRSHSLFVLAGVTVFYSYLVKITAIATLGVFAVLSLLHFRAWKRHIVFYLTVGGLLASFCLFDYFFTGGFFNYFMRDVLSGPKYFVGLGPVTQFLAWYPRWMFNLTSDQTLLFGYIFYAAIPALAYALSRRPRNCIPLIVWLIGLFLILEFLPSKLSLPYLPIGRFFRYLDALVVPSCLLIAVLVDSIVRRSRWLGGTILVFLFVSSLFWIQRTAFIYQDSLRDMKIASAFLVSLPDGNVYSDNFFLDRFLFDLGYNDEGRLKRIQEAIEQHRSYDLLASLGPGYVVTGGSRQHDMWVRAILNLGSLTPPPNWELLKTVEGKIKPWRQEPLRIFRIKAATGSRNKQPSR